MRQAGDPVGLRPVVLFARMESVAPVAQLPLGPRVLAGRAVTCRGLAATCLERCAECVWARSNERAPGQAYLGDMKEVHFTF